MDYQLATETISPSYDYTLALIDAEPTKVCRVCKVEKPYKDYHPNKQCVGGVTGTCRLCTNERKGAWYSDNRARRQSTENEVRRNLKLKAIEYKGGKCEDCSNIYPPCVYQFHHLDPSEKDFHPSSVRNWERMKSEIDKCVMLCANCHMIRHYAGGDNE